MQECPNCAKASPTRFRLCGYCGTELQSALGREIRRTVTVLFSDLQGSTSLGEALDSEALFEVLSRYFESMRKELERHGGTIEKLIGDAIVAVFGLPVAHEDDPLRAARAAARCQAALTILNDDLARAYGVRLTNRTGLATGEVTVGLPRPGEHLLTGEVLDVAARLEAAAPPMGVLLAGTTAVAIEPAATLVRTQVHGAPGRGAGTDIQDGEEAWLLVEVTAAEVAQPGATDSGATAPGVETRGASSSAAPGLVYCPNCGEVDPPDFVVCGTCGTQLAGTDAAQESRKTVTIVFCDLHATDLEGRPLLPEVLGPPVTRGFAVAREVVERHGGSAEKFIGDALVAVFGLPVLHEDDALRAARAALDMQRSLASLNVALLADGIQLSGRAGINTGLVVAGDATPGLHLVTGDAVNTAARLEQSAPEHGILVGQATYALIRDAADVEAVEPLRLKGKAEPVIAYRLLALRGQEGRARQHTATLVGRVQELAMLQRVFHESVVQNGPRLVTLLGDAGIGKSRLVREFELRLGTDARILRGRCLAYGEGTTFWPIVEIVRAAAEIVEDDDPVDARRRLQNLLGDRDVAERVIAIAGLAETPFPLVELFWGVRRFFEILAARRPLVVVVDAIQWAERAMIDLLEHVVSTSSEAPIELVCLAREELLERRPAWAPGARSTRMVLGPLSDEESQHIVDNLLGIGHDAAGIRDQVVRAGHGNPLFMEQMISLLEDNGALRSVDGRWVQADAAVEITLPPSIQALLAARVDQLPREERSVIDPAAVIGYEFGQPAVEALVADELRENVGPGLGSLVARQLVRPDPDGAPGEPAFRFKNLLIRDAVYHGLLKRSRVALHERYVAWVDAISQERGREREFEEVLGFHLEQAYRYRTEFGPADDHAAAVGRDAAHRLASAGRRSFVRGDMAAATGLFGRACALLPTRDRERLALLPELGEAYMELGRFEAAEDVLGEAIAIAGDDGEDGLLAHASVARFLVRAYRSGDVAGWVDQALAEADRAIATFERLGDHAGLTRAWRLTFGVHAAAFRLGPAAGAAERVVTYARLAGDVRQEARGSTGYAQTVIYSEVPVPEALDRCRDVLTRVGGDRRTEATVLLAMAELEGMAGNFETARGQYVRARSMLTELGTSVYAASTSLNSWRVEFLAGDLAAAERELRRDYDALDLMGEHYVLSSVAAFLGQVLLAQGRLDEAALAAARARDLADADDVASQALWRAVEAGVLVRTGRPDEGVAVAHEAYETLGSTDSPLLRADALVNLAEVLATVGRTDEAGRSLVEAIRLYDEKGNVVAAERARRQLGEMPPLPSTAAESGSR